MPNRRSTVDEQSERYYAGEYGGAFTRDSATINGEPFERYDTQWASNGFSHGPAYPPLPSVEKWRRLERKRDLTPDETRSYGRAVLAAIRLLNRPPGRVEVDLRCTCWKPDPAVKKLAALADAACEKRVGAKAFRRWKKTLVAAVLRIDLPAPACAEIGVDPMTQIEGPLFKEWRKSLKLSQSEVAALFTERGYMLGQTAVSAWEKRGVPQRAIATFRAIYALGKQAQLTKSPKAA
jgi:hypothetical protein